MKSVIAKDQYWMQEALKLARRGVGKTSPNPPVGAIIVKNGAEIGSGYHKKAGTAHAEICAIKSAGLNAKKATLYVTLEPCSTTGKTGPCTEAIISAGITRVVVAVKDPNPKHKGRGLKTLQKAGLKVVHGICSAEAEELLAPFRKWVTTGIPHLTLKLGISIDGKIADRNKASKWITSDKSRKEVKKLRKNVDGILVGTRTVRIDNPGLLYDEKSSHNPFRIILDVSGKISMKSKVLNDKNVKKTIVVTSKECPRKQTARYLAKGASVITTPIKEGKIALKKLFKSLGKKGLLHVLSEGGGELAEALIKANLVDEYIFFIAPKIIGGKNAVSAISGTGWTLPSAPKLKIVSCKKVGDDIMICATRKK